MSGINILILDANQNFSRVAREYLLARLEVSRVYTAVSIKELFSRMNITKIDILLVDDRFVVNEPAVQLVLHQLKNQYPEVIVLVMTLFLQTAIHGFLEEKNFANGWISKQEFASEMIAILKKCYTPSR